MSDVELKSLIENGFQRVWERFDALSVDLDARFVKVDERFERIDERFEKIDERLESIDVRFVKQDEKITEIGAGYENIVSMLRLINEGESLPLVARVHSLEERVTALEEKRRN